jgi:hypothetical protein
MSYVVQNKGRWYAVTYEGTDAVTGRDRRRWRRAENAAGAREICDSLPTMPACTTAGHSRSGVTVGRFLTTRWLPAKEPTLRATTFFGTGAASRSTSCRESGGCRCVVSQAHTSSVSTPSCSAQAEWVAVASRRKRC